MKTIKTLYHEKILFIIKLYRIPPRPLFVDIPPDYKHNKFNHVRVVGGMYNNMEFWMSFKFGNYYMFWQTATGVEHWAIFRNNKLYVRPETGLPVPL